MDLGYHNWSGGARENFVEKCPLCVDIGEKENYLRKNREKEEKSA